MTADIARSLNLLGEFLGMRDVPALTRECVSDALGGDNADVLILFGGSIAAGCDEAAAAMHAGAAKRLMLVGGEGHTTQALRDFVHACYPDIHTDGRMEADIMRAVLQRRCGMDTTLIERASTNCGNNVTNALAVLREAGLAPRSIVLMQDASMQRRMDAGFRRHLAGEHVTLLNYASYRVHVQMQDGAPVFEAPLPWGMWTMERYVNLLMGEIPRLRDDDQGYGPRGKGFIAHVDIPAQIQEAFAALQAFYGAATREANPAYASR